MSTLEYLSLSVRINWQLQSSHLQLPLRSNADVSLSHPPAGCGPNVVTTTSPSSFHEAVNPFIGIFATTYGPHPASAPPRETSPSIFHEAENPFGGIREAIFKETVAEEKTFKDSIVPRMAESRYQFLPTAANDGFKVIGITLGQSRMIGVFSMRTVEL